MNKISIYLVDDLEDQRENIIKNIPFASFCQFKQFQFPLTGVDLVKHPEFAQDFSETLEHRGFITYLIETNNIPDIIVIDIDYSSNSSYKKCLSDKLDFAIDSGYNVLTYLKEHKIHQKAIIVVITGQGNPKANQTLLDTSSEQLANLQNFISVIVDKQDYSNIYSQFTKKEILKKVADKYFRYLNTTQRNDLKMYIDKYVTNESIIGFEFPFGDKIFNFKDLLIGWMNDNASIENPIEIIKERIKMVEDREWKDKYILPKDIEKQLKTHFKGDFKNNSFLHNMLANHLKSDTHSEISEEWNWLAINYLCKFDKFNIDYSKKDLSCNHDDFFKQYNAFYLDIKEYDSEKFKMRMITRRIISGWAKQTNNFERFTYILNALYSNGSQDSTSKQIINIKCGFSKKRNLKYGIWLSNESLLREELTWIQEYACFLSKLIMLYQKIKERIDFVTHGKYEGNETLDDLLCYISEELREQVGNTKYEETITEVRQIILNTPLSDTLSNIINTKIV